MKKLDIIENLKDVEERKDILERLLKDMNNHYFQESHVRVETKSSAFEQYYKGESFEVSKTLFTQFVVNQIDDLKNKSDKFVKMLGGE